MENKFSLSLGIDQKDISVSDDKGYVDIEGFASRMSVNGVKVIDLDGEYVETSGFTLEAKRLLLNHDMHEPVGDLTLSHAPEGVRIKARAYKKAMEEKEYERVKLGLYDFSIGFIASEVDYREINGKNIRCFTKGSIYETSLVAIPSNQMATIDSIKSKMKEDEIPTKRELEKHLRDSGLSRKESAIICSRYDDKQKSVENQSVDIFAEIAKIQ